MGNKSPSRAPKPVKEEKGESGFDDVATSAAPVALTTAPSDPAPALAPAPASDPAPATHASPSKRSAGSIPVENAAIDDAEYNLSSPPIHYCYPIVHQLPVSSPSSPAPPVTPDGVTNPHCIDLHSSCNRFLVDDLSLLQIARRQVGLGRTAVVHRIVLEDGTPAALKQFRYRQPCSAKVAAEFRAEVEALALLSAVCGLEEAKHCVCRGASAGRGNEPEATQAQVERLSGKAARSQERERERRADRSFLCTCRYGLRGHFAAPLRICADPKKGLGVVLEWVPGSLHQLLQAGQPMMSIADVMSAGLGVAKGLLLLHRAGIVHRDVKPHNILIARAANDLESNTKASSSNHFYNSSPAGSNSAREEKQDEAVESKGGLSAGFAVVKVCDFGLSVLLSSGADLSGQRVGTSGWAAPEVMCGGHHGKPADVFSFAVCISALLNGPGGGNALAGLTSSNYYAAVQNGERAEVSRTMLEERQRGGGWHKAGQGLLVLMRECWRFEPEERPTFEEIVPRLAALAGYET